MNILHKRKFLSPSKSEKGFGKKSAEWIKKDKTLCGENFVMSAYYTIFD